MDSREHTVAHQAAQTVLAIYDPVENSPKCYCTIEGVPHQAQIRKMKVMCEGCGEVYLQDAPWPTHIPIQNGRPISPN